MPPTVRAPRGKLVNADDVLYHPTVISADPDRAFGDFPGPVNERFLDGRART